MQTWQPEKITPDVEFCVHANKLYQLNSDANSIQADDFEKANPGRRATTESRPDVREP